jgi:hypothetical protein
MDVSLRVGHFDARLAAEAINPESDLGSHLQGVCSTDIKPEKDVKCQRVVTEGLEGDGAAGSFKTSGCASTALVRVLMTNSVGVP